jgi:hypothetical protein
MGLCSEQDISSLLTPALLSMSIKCLHALKSSLESAQRLGDTDLIELGCSVIWRLSLPLLQASSHHLLLDVFEQCADALEAVGSNNALLRVQFRVESAKIELDADFVETVPITIRSAKQTSKELPLQTHRE